MQKKHLQSVIIFLSCLFLLMAVPAAAKTHKWKIQSPIGASSPLFKSLERWAERVGVMSGGRVQITMYSGQSIVPAPEMLDAMTDNILQGVFVTPQYWAGKNPAFAFCSDINGGYTEPWQFITWYNKKGGRDFLNKLYEPYGVVSVGAALWGTESIPSKKPIEKVADFKGIKIRSAPGIASILFEKMGASPIVLPGTEVYSALDKGVIDATDLGTPALNESYGFHQVANYFNYPGIHSMPLADIALNKSEWEKLSDDLKVLVEGSIHWLYTDTVQTMVVEDIEAVKRMKKAGAIVTVWSDEERNKFRAIAREAWVEFAKKGPDCQAILDSHIAWMKDLGLLD